MPQRTWKASLAPARGLRGVVGCVPSRGACWQSPELGANIPSGDLAGFARSSVPVQIQGMFIKRFDAARCSAIVFWTVICLGLGPLALSAADWPQWRGLQRNGHSAETGL